jgi:hypothetical protein
MAILGFSVCRPQLEARTKCQTIRRFNEESKRPRKVGDPVSIWWKPRTTERVKMGEGIITEVITIRVWPDMDAAIENDKYGEHTRQKLSIDQLNEIAKKDGFDEWSQLFAVLSAWYSWPQTLEVIRWKWLK